LLLTIHRSIVFAGGANVHTQHTGRLAHASLLSSPSWDWCSQFSKLAHFIALTLLLSLHLRPLAVLPMLANLAYVSKTY